MQKSNTINKICENYITINNEFSMDFKPVLKKEILNNKISKFDALYIVLELLYCTKSDLRYDGIGKKFSELLYKSMQDVNRGYEKLFFKIYTYEINIIIDYITLLAEEKNIEINKNKFNIKSIQKSLNRFSRMELLYILDLNPDVNFEKDKAYKKEIASKLAGVTVDENALENCSPDFIKDLLASHNAKNYYSDIIRLNNPYLFKLRCDFKDMAQGKFENEKIKKLIYERRKKHAQNNREFNELNKKSNSHNLCGENKLVKKSIKQGEKQVQPKESIKQGKKPVYPTTKHAERIRKFKKEKNIGLERFTVEEYKKLSQEKEDNVELNKTSIVGKELVKEKLKSKEFKEKTSHSSLNKKNSNNKNNNDHKFKEKTSHSSLNKKNSNNKNNNDHKFKVDKSSPNKKIKPSKSNFKLEQINKQKEAEERSKALDKVRIFNNKSFSEMIQLKEDYKSIHFQLSNMPNVSNKQEVKNFNYIFSNFNKIEKLHHLENQLDETKGLITKFFNELDNSDYLSFTKRKEIYLKYKKLYDLGTELKNFPDFLNKKIFKNFINFKKFMLFFNDLKNYSRLDGNANNQIKILNETFINQAITDNRKFFNDIKDFNKKKAIVIDEDNVRVIAGAGTGKTFTIQNKVKYLIEKQKTTPDKILCLCFTRKSATQLKHRVNNQLDDEKKVGVYTFHEFARLVDTECGGSKTTNKYLLDNIIRNHIKEMMDDSGRIDKLIEYFSYYRLPSDYEKQFNTEREFLEFEKGKDLIALREKYKYSGQKYSRDLIRTMKDEAVRSLEELLIANYLFMHEINYEYEMSYPYGCDACILKRFLYSVNYMQIKQFSEKPNNQIIHEFMKWLSRNENYHPDFYLPDYDIYLEHFGVNENYEAVWLNNDEKIKYEKEMKLKRIMHKSCGTKLIETYSFYKTDDILLEELESILRANNVKIGQRNKKEILKILFINNKINEYKKFKNLVKSFINIFEAKNLPKEEFYKFKEKNLSSIDKFNNKRQKIFFEIATEIYDKYYEYNQGDDIDHNREISNALNLIQNNEFKCDYDYILIDEYQDINHIRCKLIQELQKKSDSKVFVVGDDWQSIYGFSGSQVDLFKDFDHYFPNSETIKLKESRRNPQRINEITRKFIMENRDNQVDKKLKYYKDNSNPNPILFIEYGEEYLYQKILRLDAILQDIIKSTKKLNPKILILSRYNEDIQDYVNNSLFTVKQNNKYLKIIYSKKRDLDITFMSIHQSKGLEYDEVIILNVSEGYMGFPSQIKDDPIIKLIKDNENFPFAEERRLFYVALTRTKNRVYILYPENRKSEFIKELEREFKFKKTNLKIDYTVQRKLFNDDGEFFERIERYPTKLKCPVCGEGNIMIVVNNHNKNGKRTQFVGCSEYPKCDYLGGTFNTNLENIKYIEHCPSCKGVMVRQGDVLKCSMNYFNGCLEIKDLKLEKDDLKYHDFEE